jgi:hypothetical protein
MRELLGMNRLPTWAALLIGFLAGVGFWAFASSRYGSWPLVVFFAEMFVFIGIGALLWSGFIWLLATFIWCWERWDWLRLRWKYRKRRAFPS